jgi:serine/threonine protein kinase
MLVGKTPWRSKTEKELKHELAIFKIEDILPQNISPRSREFLIRTMRKDVDKRMSLKELMAFRFN